MRLRPGDEDVTTQMDAGGLLVAAALGLVVWLPAAWAAGRRLSWTVPAILSTAFSLAMVATGVAGVAAHVTGASLGVVVVLLLVQAAVLAALAWRFRGDGAIRPGTQGIVVGALVGGLAFYQRPWFEFTADTFYHLAAARSLLATGAPLVTDPLHKTGTATLDPTSGIFHTWLAAASRVSGTEVEYLYAGFAALAAALVAWAVWALAERVSGSETVATVAAVGFAAFGLWGDFRMAGLPNRFAVAFLCVALLASYDAARSAQKRPSMLVVVIAGAAALMTHLASAGALLLFAMAAGVVALLFRRRLAGTSTAPLLAPVLVALLLALPAIVSKVTAVLASPMTGQPESLPEAFVPIGAGMLFTKPGKYIGGGPVAFVLMGVIAVWALHRGYRDRDAATMSLGAFLAVPVVLLSFPPVTTLAATVSLYMLTRIVLMMKFLPFIAAAWAIGLGLTDARGRVGQDALKRWGLLLAGIALVVSHGLASWQMTQVTYVRVPDRMRIGEAHTIAESRARDIRTYWSVQTLDSARAVFGDSYPIVAASAETGYYLAGLTDVAIVIAPDSHTPLALGWDERGRRREDMDRLLDPETTEAERRAILEDYDADYVALWLAKNDEIHAWESMLTQPGLFEPVVESRRLGIMRVVR